LHDWTFTDEFIGVDIAGLDIERWVHRGGHCMTGHSQMRSQGWTLHDWTLRDEFTGVDIAGRDIER